MVNHEKTNGFCIFILHILWISGCFRIALEVSMLTARLQNMRATDFRLQLYLPASLANNNSHLGPNYEHGKLQPKSKSKPVIDISTSSLNLTDTDSSILIQHVKKNTKK